jgi:hypothetical protein
MRYSDEQVMLSLAFVSYSGFYDPSTGLLGSKRTFESISDALKNVPSLSGEWTIVWGPAHHRLPLTVFDENLMFVVQSTRDPAHFVVVIRGTNPVSVTNWLLQDFAIVVQTPWPYDAHPGSLEPKLSKGTARGLQALQGMKPELGLPGAGVNLYQFLANRVYESGGRELRLSVTGHSLGGALAPTLALWLLDTRQHSDDPDCPGWDRELKTRIEVTAFAGPSPGNKDFAEYYDSKLGERTRRIYNSFDVVPHGWASAALQKLPSLYDPDITPDWFMKLLLRAALLLAHGRDYVQIMSRALPLEGGKVSGVVREYMAEMTYQHTAAYSNLLKLGDAIDSVFHFGLDESFRAAVDRPRDAENGTAPLRAAPSAEAPLAALLHRAYRIPASFLLPFVPKHLALAHQRRRQSHYHRRRAAERNGAPEGNPLRERNASREQNSGRSWGGANERSRVPA